MKLLLDQGLPRSAVKYLADLGIAADSGEIASDRRLTSPAPYGPPVGFQPEGNLEGSAARPLREGLPHPEGNSADDAPIGAYVTALPSPGIQQP